MKVLITGGYGFIGSFVAEKFYREGHEVHILDNLSTGHKENIHFRHQSYLLHIEDEKCEEVFRANHFDVVIHLAAQVDVKTSVESPTYDSKVNVLGVINMLQLAKKYKVSSFVFASSAAVYGNNPALPLTEDEKCNPSSPYGMSKLMGESYCQFWSGNYGINTLCLRFSNVYGPKQNNDGEGGVVSIFLNKLINKQTIEVFGDGSQTRDFIYVEDVSEAIYRGVMSDTTGIYNLSTNTENSINQLVAALEQLETLTGLVHKKAREGDIKNSRLENERIKREFDWLPKYQLEEGLEKTYHWFKDKKKQSVNNKAVRKKSLFQKMSETTIFPIIENLILFIVSALAYIKFDLLFGQIDILLLYILIVGVVLGKNQVMIACALSIMIYIWEGLQNGREIVALFTDNSTLIQFAVYIFVGLIIGYVIEKKNVREQHAISELKLFEEKYQLLNGIYTETKNIKEQLQTQILHSEQSVGEIYQIIKKIDSLEPDEIFNGVISVLETIMKTEEAAIYLVGNSEEYLRLISKSSHPHLTFPSSIKVKDSSAITDVMKKKQIYINRSLDPHTPLMIAPIMKDNKPVAIICINDTDFNNLTLYYENLFQVVINLISSSITRAFDYVNATKLERYILNTRVLKPEYLTKAMISKRKAKEQLNIPFTLLKLESNTEIVQQAAIKVANSLRETDFIGIDNDDNYWILLSNTNKEDALTVMKRIKPLLGEIQIKEEEMYA
ncbi:NAD-dependent epimerase/dehydratase family protein [Cytobacillus sp. IB215665]|uniref:NAD-dependent epimerase/dehydratase family protein n=1 Tax=Cytobacillus sp. IB215665 TaxID=3097357 RepID=UPI002A0D450C|nr:NAD-dependent epimerase/dehydratase family protein [Cytobacillus sp. IB215665]MDX8366087.1 NAD-dependent epimerase/dehydratase family protein [Cytobacillus sp. IB215665]